MLHWKVLNLYIKQYIYQFNHELAETFVFIRSFLKSSMSYLICNKFSKTKCLSQNNLSVCFCCRLLLQYYVQIWELVTRFYGIWDICILFITGKKKYTAWATLLYGGYSQVGVYCSDIMQKRWPDPRYISPLA